MSKQNELAQFADVVTVNSGKVGIGTAAPSFPLSVQSNSSAEGLLILGRSSDDIGEIAFRENDNSTALGELQYRQDHAILRHRVGDLRFATGGTTERMRIDATGAVTMPHQPAFLVAPSGAQSNITVGNEVTVVFGTEIFDQNADFASNQFTAPVTGRYQLNLTLYINAIDSASDYYHIKIWTSNRIYSSVIDPGVLASDPVYWNIPIAVLADMDLGDIAKVTIKQNNGTAQTDIINETTFSGHLVA